MSNLIFYPRSVQHRLVEALEDSPVVLIHGPRQCGKTTLAQTTCAPKYANFGNHGSTPRHSQEDRDYRYFTFDDPAVRDGAHADPNGFVHDLPERVILDEVQKAPEILIQSRCPWTSNGFPDVFCWRAQPIFFLFPNYRTLWRDECRLYPCTR